MFRLKTDLTLLVLTCFDAPEGRLWPKLQSSLLRT